MPLQVSVCGPIEVQGIANIVYPETRIRRCLAAILALHHGHWVSARTLIERTWEHDRPSAQANLRSQIAALRQDLTTADGPGQYIQSRRGGGGMYRLDLEPSALDITRIEWLLGTARNNVSSGAHLEALRQYAQARQLWRGTFGEDLPQTAWVTAEQSRLTDIRRHVSTIGAAVYLLLGEHRKASAALQEQAQSPGHGPTWHLKACAQYLAGDSPAALTTIMDCQNHFHELGIDAPQGTTRLQRAVLQDDKPLVMAIIRDLA